MPILSPRRLLPCSAILSRAIVKTILIAGLAFVGSVPALAADAVPAWVSDARHAAQALGGQLKGALTRAVESSGLNAAVAVCQLQAPAIADGVSNATLTVSRTALRVRNPDNAPDAWERHVLEDFERRLALGEDPARMEVFAIRNKDGNSRGHWMKAIPTGGLCLACHGANVDPDLRQTIDERYPQDQATGFEAGSLRGAFSVSVDLPEPD